LPITTTAETDAGVDAKLARFGKGWTSGSANRFWAMCTTLGRILPLEIATAVAGSISELSIQQPDVEASKIVTKKPDLGITRSRVPCQRNPNFC